MNIYFSPKGNLSSRDMAYLIKLSNPFAVSVSRDFLRNPVQALKKRERWASGRVGEILDACMDEMIRVWEEKNVLNGPMENSQSVTKYLIAMKNPARPDSGDDWENVYWAFPDEAIARAMKVTRQAVQQQRKKRETGEPAENYGEYNRMMLEDVARSLNIPFQRVMDIERIGVDRLLDMLSDFPDAEPEFMDMNMERLAERFGAGRYGAILYVSKKKNLGIPDVVQLLHVIAPEVDHDAELSRATGIPAATLSEIRTIPAEQVDEKFAWLPDHGSTATNDAIVRLSIRKAVSQPQAARLLYLAFPAERKPDSGLNNQIAG